MPYMRAADDCRPASAALVYGMKSSRFIMAYQPIVSLSDGSVVGHEALLRVVGPDGALRAPVETIRRAEVGRKTLALDTRVADLVVADLAAEDQLGTVHLNVSAATAQDHGPEMVDHLAETLESSGVPASSLVVEITETAPVTDLDAVVRFAEGVRQLGAGICLDDLGDGTLGVEHLDCAPWDAAKLSASLVARYADEAPRIEATLEAISSRRIVSVVEGVPDRRTGKRLHAAGAELGQAYIYGLPQTLPEIARQRAG